MPSIAPSADTFLSLHLLFGQLRILTEPDTLVHGVSGANFVVWRDRMSFLPIDIKYKPRVPSACFDRY